jgi:hypothetical protein
MKEKIGLNVGQMWSLSLIIIWTNNQIKYNIIQISETVLPLCPYHLERMTNGPQCIKKWNKEKHHVLHCVKQFLIHFGVKDGEK